MATHSKGISILSPQSKTPKDEKKKQGREQKILTHSVTSLG
jgi:hypothetical protein